MVAVPAVPVAVTSTPLPVRPKPLPVMLKLPNGDVSLTITVMPTSPASSLTGANPVGVAENPAVVVSNTTMSPVFGTAFSSQFPAVLHWLPAAPVQWSRAGRGGLRVG